MADDWSQQGIEMDDHVLVEENHPMIHFRDLNLDLLTSRCNFSAKVFFKSTVKLHMDGNYIRLILVDEEGTRMEALAFGTTCLDLARTIVEGYSYDFIDVVVGYKYDLNYLNVFRVYGAEFFASVTSDSRVTSSRRPIAYPVFPRTFTLFHQVIHFGAHKSETDGVTLPTDVIGVVVYISDVHDRKRTWRRPSRHVAIMNMCIQIVVIHVRSPHIMRHAGEWRPAAQYFNLIAALHVQMNRRRGVLVTTRYSNIIFEPDRPEADAMRAFQSRLKNAPNQARQLGRDRLKDMNVL